MAVVGNFFVTVTEFAIRESTSRWHFRRTMDVLEINIGKKLFFRNLIYTTVAQRLTAIGPGIITDFSPTLITPILCILSTCRFPMDAIFPFTSTLGVVQLELLQMDFLRLYDWASFLR